VRSRASWSAARLPADPAAGRAGRPGAARRDTAAALPRFARRAGSARPLHELDLSMLLCTAIPKLCECFSTTNAWIRRRLIMMRFAGLLCRAIPKLCECFSTTNAWTRRRVIMKRFARLLRTAIPKSYVCLSKTNAWIRRHVINRSVVSKRLCRLADSRPAERERGQYNLAVTYVVEPGRREHRPKEGRERTRRRGRTLPFVPGARQPPLQDLDKNLQALRETGAGERATRATNRTQMR
jgi:hypothetical protein